MSYEHSVSNDPTDQEPRPELMGAKVGSILVWGREGRGNVYFKVTKVFRAYVLAETVGQAPGWKAKFRKFDGRSVGNRHHRFFVVFYNLAVHCKYEQRAE